jgi:hypothetical protein
MVIESDSSHSLSWLSDFNNKQAIIKIIDSSVPPSLVALIPYVTEIKVQRFKLYQLRAFITRYYYSYQKHKRWIYNWKFNLKIWNTVVFPYDHSQLSNHTEGKEKKIDNLPYKYVNPKTSCYGHM